MRWRESRKRREGERRVQGAGVFLLAIAFHMGDNM